MHALARGTPAGEAQVAFSPDGNSLAFLRGGDLWLAPVADLTSDAVRRTNIAGSGVRLTSAEVRKPLPDNAVAQREP